MVQAPVSGHLSPYTHCLLVAAYKDHSCKPTAPVTDTLSTSRGCPLTGASTVPIYYNTVGRCGGLVVGIVTIRPACLPPMQYLHVYELLEGQCN